MIINSGDTEPRIIDDYDFLFANGIAWPVTIDKDAGDSIDFQESQIIVRIAGRPSAGDPSLSTAFEEQTILRANLNIICHRTREVVPQSPEFRNDIAEFIKQKASKTIH